MPAHDALPDDPDPADTRPGPRPVHLRATSVALVLVGGCAGTAARLSLGVLAPTHPGRWPVGTFVANLVGAFVLGVLLEALVRAGDDSGTRQRLRLLVGTGFCGGLTTYSTFAVEADLLVRADRPALAVAYLAVTVVAGLVTAVLGIAAAAHRGRAS